MSLKFRRLIDEKSKEVVVGEGFARELAEVAHALQQGGHSVIAEGMRNLSRHHRVRGMRVRAEIAVLSGQSGREPDAEG